MNKIREGVNFFSEVSFPSFDGLHPTSFSSKLAQNERTVFTFLGSSETFGFQDLTKELDFPDLVMPRHIFDYFINNQGSCIYDHLTHRRWIEVLNAIDRAGDQDEKTLNILKTIGLLNIIGTLANLRSSYDLLSIIYGSKVLDQSKALQKKSLITYRKHSDEYKVWQGSDFDLEAALNKLDQFEDFDIANELNRLVMPTPLVAKKYSVESHTLNILKPYISDKNFVIDPDQLSLEPELYILLKQNKVKQADLNNKYKELPSNILIIEVNSKNLFESNAKGSKRLNHLQYL